MGRGHLAAAAAVLLACGSEPLSLAAFESQSLYLECVGSECAEDLGLRLEGGLVGDKRCELDDDVQASQDGRPMRLLSAGRFVHSPGFLWEPPEDHCEPARWRLVDTQPREVTTFEVRDATATISMELRLAFEPRSAELVAPTSGSVAEGETVAVRWSPAEDRLWSAAGVVGPDEAPLASVSFHPASGAVYEGIVDVVAAQPASGELRVFGFRDPNALVISCAGIARCYPAEYSRVSLGTIEVRP